MSPKCHRFDIFFEHGSQYFSIIVTPSPTSNQASKVARLPQVEQYFGFFSLELFTYGFSANKDLSVFIRSSSRKMRLLKKRQLWQKRQQ
jgi:hypothetical protein